MPDRYTMDVAMNTDHNEPRLSDKYGFRVDLLIRLAPTVMKLRSAADYPVHVVDCIPAQRSPASPLGAIVPAMSTSWHIAES